MRISIIVVAVSFLGLAIVLAFFEKSSNNKTLAEKKPTFTIGKDTTFILGPLDKDGYPDYAAAINERYGKGVTAENNVMVPFWQAVGPHHYGRTMPADYFKMLGTSVPPEMGEYFVGFDDFVKQRPGVDPNQRLQIEKEMEPSCQRAWTAHEFPHLADWLDANQEPLKKLIEASQRSHCFSPIVKDASTPGLDMIDALPPTFMDGAVVKSLICRAMLRVGERRFDNAWLDLIAAHRLGRHFGSGPVLTDSISGLAIRNMAIKAELAFIERTDYDAEQLRKCLNDLRELSLMPNLADQVNFGERLFELDYILTASREGLTRIEKVLLSAKKDFNGLNDLESKTGAIEPGLQNLLDDIDWDPILRHANDECDRVAIILRLKDRGTRIHRLQRMHDSEAKKTDDLPTVDGLVTSLLEVKSDPVAKGKIIFKVFASLGETASDYDEAFDRAEQAQRNLHIAFALAAYHADHENYPKSLHDLSPAYVEKVPDDYFTGKPLFYRPYEKGYLLYSVGPNGADDGGHGAVDDPPADDIFVRMPIPEPRKK